LALEFDRYGALALECNAATTNAIVVKEKNSANYDGVQTNPN